MIDDIKLGLLAAILLLAIYALTDIITEAFDARAQAELELRR